MSMNILLIGGALNSKYSAIQASIVRDRAGKPHTGIHSYVSTCHAQPIVLFARPYFNAWNSVACRRTTAVSVAIVAETHGQEKVEPLQSLRLIGVEVKQAKKRGNGTETLRGERENDAPFLFLIIARRTDPDAHYVMHMQAAKRIKKECVKGQVIACDAPVSVLCLPL